MEVVEVAEVVEEVALEAVLQQAPALPHLTMGECEAYPPSYLMECVVMLTNFWIDFDDTRWSINTTNVMSLQGHTARRECKVSVGSRVQ